MTKLKNKNFERLVRPNESIQVLTITNPDIPFGKHYPLGTIVSSFYEDNWWLLTLTQEVGPADTLRGVTKTEYTIDYIENRPVGEELVVNGDFLTDLSGWTVDVSGDGAITRLDVSEVQISCGAPLNFAAMWQAQNLEIGADYKLVIDHDGGTGTMETFIAGVQNVLDSGGGTETFLFTAVNGNDLYIQSSGACDYTIYTISLKKLI